jgi:uncharacterized alkaline shock family protein YloU
MTTIAPEVLLSIARLTTLSVEGVSRMSTTPGGVNRLLRRGHQNEGVHIEIDQKTVSADIYVYLEKGVAILEVSRNIQKEVARAISDMVGMEVGHINIHIEDIYFPTEE